jgi:hypothetical protein
MYGQTQEPIVMEDLAAQEDLPAQDPPSKPKSTGESVMESIQEAASSRRPSGDMVMASGAALIVTAQLELTGPDKIVVLEVLQHTDYHQGSSSSQRTSGPSSLVHTVIPTSKPSMQAVENLLSNDTCAPNKALESKSQHTQSQERVQSQLPHVHQVEIVIGKDVEAAKGMLVQLTSQGLANMDQHVLCLSGSNDSRRQGRITQVMNKGKVCAVSWHARPNQEHFHCTGRWDKYELAVARTQTVPPGGRLEERVGMVPHVGGMVQHVVGGISDSLGAAPGIFRGGKGGKASSYEEFLVGAKLNVALNGVDREGSWNGVDNDHDAGQVYSQVQKRGPLIIPPLRLASVGREWSIGTKSSSREFTTSPTPPTVCV